MHLLLLRSQLSKICTLGDLCISDGNGEIGPWICYTLEDPWHEQKVYGDTCIPEGRYEIVLSLSTRFKRTLPRLLNVPGFVGVLVHGGNTKENTLGCILVGSKRNADEINTCEPAVEAVIKLLSGVPSAEHNFITIKKAENV